MGYNTRYESGLGALISVGQLVQRATAALPASTTAPLFTVTGVILLRQIYAVVTTAVQAQATTLKLQSNPTVAGSSVDLCLATTDLNAAPVGSIWGITGVLGAAASLGLSIVGQTTPIIVQAGTIDAVTVATSTGSLRWVLRYQILENGSTVAAA